MSASDYPTQQQYDNAIKAGEALGIMEDELNPIVNDLFQAFERNWDYIEADNFRVLIETYYDRMEDKGVKEKVDFRPSKRLRRVKEQDQSSSRSGSSGPSLKLSSGRGNDRRPPLTVHPGRVPSSGVSHGNNRNGFTKPKNKVPINDVAVSAEPTSSRRSGPGAPRIAHHLRDITRSSEKVQISLVDASMGAASLPKFTYISENTVYQSAHLNISLARIADDDCCKNCTGDCLSSEIPCACSCDTGGEFMYTQEGRLKEDFLSKRLSLLREPEKQYHNYCQESQVCPVEMNKNNLMPEKCQGHLLRSFIKECWKKCGCNMKCGNRVVQRGISCNLQVYWTGEEKGWGVRALDDLEKGSFVCEYVGEILTNTELYQRNKESSDTERHTYPVTLDADWGSERILRDEEALCLDATHYGNVARFINHRCFDTTLVDIPVQVETPDRHYYHLAFFTTRKVRALEELTWDYGIDFDDENHPIKAFQCTCGSQYCRGRGQKGKKVATL